MANNIWAIPLAVTDFNVIVAFLGGFISLFGLVSYLLKEKYYMSEARECPLSSLHFVCTPSPCCYCCCSFSHFSRVLTVLRLAEWVCLGWCRGIPKTSVHDHVGPILTVEETD
jgi:hypothetical protein